MNAIVLTDQAAGNGRDDAGGAAGATAAINDAVVEIHVSGFVPTEMARPSTWVAPRP